MADDERRKWVDELPADIGPFKELLHEYSHIPWEEVDAHIHKIVTLPPPLNALLPEYTVRADMKSV